MATLEDTQQEWGKLAKRGCERAGIGMDNYNPSTQTYTPWYKMPIKVEFGEMPPKSYGKFNLWKRNIKINPSSPDVAATLYHESLHADVAPITQGISAVAALGSIGYSICSAFQPELREAGGFLSPMTIASAALGIAIGMRRGEEYLVRLQERKIFGRNN